MHTAFLNYPEGIVVSCQAIMKNSDRFLIAFNSIERTLKDNLQADQYMPFSRLISNAKRNNAVIRRFYDDLKEFSELRNAIVHNTFDLNHAIAEPHESIVEQIEFIEQEINKPKKVIPLFQKKVTAFQSDDTLKDILQAINRFSYSKFPVYDDTIFTGLLSKKGIVNWLAKNVEELTSVSFLNTPLRALLEYENKQKNYKFIDRNATIYDVREFFKSINGNDSSRIDALLIAEHGNPDEALLGIITPWDLINMP